MNKKIERRLPPYQLNGRGNPIDLNDPKDCELVIKRNKFLQESIDNGVQLYDVEIKASIHIEFPCFKCGSTIELTNSPNLENGYYAIELEELFAKVKCSCCGSKFRIDEDNNIFLTQQKTIKKK
ncbi:MULTISPECIES: hypothetical protein [Sphingobacterium]|uniref:hypothetical protein n=1 Tax=Sphingobacterium TaxID=28453 RepID=UPI00257CA4C2|nr:MULTISPECIES: hypothetical protein [Sphingobacterium]